MRYQPRAVIVASERMDGERGWVPREAGELLHVDGDFAVMPRPSPSIRPQRPVAVKDLDCPRQSRSEGALPCRRLGGPELTRDRVRAGADRGRWACS